MQKVRFAYNPKAGETGITDWLDNIIDIYQRGGYSIMPYRLAFTEAEETDLLDDIDGSYHHILVAGGDGTVNYVVNMLKRRNLDLPVAVLPTGTANDFANTLGVPSDIEKACRRILGGEIRRVDLGRANDEYFVNVFSCGLFTDVSQKTPTILKNTFGKLAYYFGGLGELPNFRKMHISIESDGGNYEGPSLIFFVFNGRTAAEMMKSERRVCPVDEEGRFSLTLSDVDNGDHYFRAYMVIDGKTYNGVTGWFEVKVASVPEVTTELSEAAGGVLTLKGSYKLDRDLSVEPGFRYAATADGGASVQFVRATQVDEANKTFSLDIPDTGQPCFFQAVVRMSTDFYDGEVSEVIRPKDLSAAGVANCYIVTEGGWYSIEPKRPDGTAVQGSAADWVWSSGSGLVSGVHFSAGRIVFQTSGNAGNAGIALTNDAGEIVWSWHIWMAQAPAEQTVNGRTFLDRNVGATEFDGALVGSLGVYFQWGRKDPFIGANRIQKNYTDEYEGVGFQTTGDNGFTALFLYNDALCEGFKFVNKEMDMSMSIANPTVFYGVYNSGGWKGSNSEVEDYWGGASGTKTNNDPCPAGYRVPTFDEINGFIKDIDTNKTAQENVSDQSYGRKYTVGDQTFMFPGSALRVWSAKMRYPGRVTFFWSSTISPTTEKKALDFYDYRWNTNADNTCCAMAVRCIKIQ